MREASKPAPAWELLMKLWGYIFRESRQAVVKVCNPWREEVLTKPGAIAAWFRRCHSENDTHKRTLDVPKGSLAQWIDLSCRP